MLAAAALVVGAAAAEVVVAAAAEVVAAGAEAAAVVAGELAGEELFEEEPQPARTTSPARTTGRAAVRERLWPVSLEITIGSSCGRANRFGAPGRRPRTAGAYAPRWSCLRVDHHVGDVRQTQAELLLELAGQLVGVSERGLLIDPQGEEHNAAAIGRKELDLLGP